eukprot:362321-Chlamydomonas_euryale.AAC.4
MKRFSIGSSASAALGLAAGEHAGPRNPASDRAHGSQRQLGRQGGVRRRLRRTSLAAARRRRGKRSLGALPLSRRHARKVHVAPATALVHLWPQTFRRSQASRPCRCPLSRGVRTRTTPSPSPGRDRRNAGRLAACAHLAPCHAIAR